MNIKFYQYNIGKYIMSANIYLSNEDIFTIHTHLSAIAYSQVQPLHALVITWLSLHTQTCQSVQISWFFQHANC